MRGLEFHLFVDLVKYGQGIMVNAQDVINITEDVSIITKVIVRSSFCFTPEVRVSFARRITQLLHE
jgi:hypothetical protein